MPPPPVLSVLLWFSSEGCGATGLLSTLPAARAAACPTPRRRLGGDERALVSLALRAKPLSAARSLPAMFVRRPGTGGPS